MPPCWHACQHGIPKKRRAWLWAGERRARLTARREAQRVDRRLLEPLGLALLQRRASCSGGLYGPVLEEGEWDKKKGLVPPKPPNPKKPKPPKQVKDAAENQ